MVVDLVTGELDRVHERIAGRFKRAEPRTQVREYLCGLVAGLERARGVSIGRADAAALSNPCGRQPPAD